PRSHAYPYGSRRTVAPLSKTDDRGPMMIGSDTVGFGSAIVTVADDRLCAITIGPVLESTRCNSTRASGLAITVKVPQPISGHWWRAPISVLTAWSSNSRSDC